MNEGKKKLVIGHGGSGGVGSIASTSMHPEEVKRRRQIQSILAQGDRDITAGNGSDWDEVKQRMRDRIAAWTR